MARYKIQFWLNSQKPDELTVADTVAELKQHRSFSAVVRDGIMIVTELRQGKIDTLLRLYPWVKDAIAELLPPPEPTPTPSNSELIEQLRTLLNEREGRAIPDGRSQGFPLMSPKPAGYVPSIAAPVAVIAAAKVPDAGEIADNFLAFLQ